MNRLGKIGLVIITVFFLAALCAPWLAPYDPAEQLPMGRDLPTQQRLKTIWGATCSQGLFMARGFRCGWALQ
jgi:ABC-type dipeptide/oligopeptide/nickel transport system permease subunit